MQGGHLQGHSRENKDIGDEGEGLAVAYLIEHGFKIVDRNVRYKTGEIDIVARRGKGLHFIEVKSRNDPTLVPPLESITEAKKSRMRRTAEWFLLDSRNNFKDNKLPPCYFGVIGIDFINGVPEIECVLDAFV